MNVKIKTNNLFEQSIELKEHGHIGTTWKKCNYEKYHRSIGMNMKITTNNLLEYSSLNRKKMDTRDFGIPDHTAYDHTSPEFSGYMFHALNKYIGSEQQVKFRRETTEICNRIMSHNSKLSGYLSGSYAEGFRLKSSDTDMMFIAKSSLIVDKFTMSNKHCDTVYLEMISNHCPPGFTRLKVVNHDANEKTEGRFCIHSDLPISNPLTFLFKPVNICRHGPSVNLSRPGEIDVDCVASVSCVYWPPQASEFISRCQQSRWPSPTVIDDIIQSGCHAVAVSSKFSEFGNSEWRISFSMAECKIIRTFDHTQFLCYGLLKLVLTHIIKPLFPEMLCSYFMKTTIFWEIQGSENRVWLDENILDYFWKCLQRLTRWVNEGNCPNFFIPENNMFFGRFSVKEQQELSVFLQRLNQQGNAIFSKIQDLHMVMGLTYICYRLQRLDQTIEKNISELKDLYTSKIRYRDFIVHFIEISEATTCGDTSQLHRCLQDPVLNGTNCRLEFLAEIPMECILTRLLCRAMHQFLSKGKLRYIDRYEIYRTQVRYYMERLQEGSPTARLWAAAARYAIGHYRHAIEIILSAKQLLKPVTCKAADILVEMVDEKRIFLPVIHHFDFFAPELYPEIKAGLQAKVDCRINGRIYADWLLFMCYHHSNDIRHRNAVLPELHALLFDDLWKVCEPQSVSLNMVGLCYAISGDKQNALELYKESLQLGDEFSSATVFRIQQLDNGNMFHRFQGDLLEQYNQQYNQLKG